MKLLRSLLAVLPMLILISACVPGTPGPKTIQLEALDIKWDKIELEARAGQTITLVIENKGVLDHDFVIEELGIEVKLSPGETQEVTFVVDEIGTYTYICAVPGHLDAGMIGQLTISE